MVVAFRRTMGEGRQPMTPTSSADDLLLSPGGDDEGDDEDDDRRVNENPVVDDMGKHVGWPPEKEMLRIRRVVLAERAAAAAKEHEQAFPKKRPRPSQPQIRHQSRSRSPSSTPAWDRRGGHRDQTSQSKEESDLQNQSEEERASRSSDLWEEEDPTTAVVLRPQVGASPRPRAPMLPPNPRSGAQRRKRRRQRATEEWWS